MGMRTVWECMLAWGVSWTYHQRGYLVVLLEGGVVSSDPAPDAQQDKGAGQSEDDLQELAPTSRSTEDCALPGSAPGDRKALTARIPGQ